MPLRPTRPRAARGLAVLTAPLLALALAPLLHASTAAAAAVPAPVPAAADAQQVAPAATSTGPRVLRVGPSPVVLAASTIAVRFSEPVTGVTGQSMALTSGGRSLPVWVTQPEDGLVLLDPTAPLLPGGSYVLSVSSAVRDLAGNPVVPVRRPVTVSTLVDDASPVFQYGAGWTRPRATDAKAGRYSVASRPATVSFSLYGKGFALGSCSGTSSGRFEVRVDGVLRLPSVLRVRGDGYRPYSRCGTMAVVPGLAEGRHDVTLTVLGTKRPASRGTAVGLDALRVFR